MKNLSRFKDTNKMRKLNVIHDLRSSFAVTDTPGQQAKSE